MRVALLLALCLLALPPVPADAPPTCEPPRWWPAPMWTFETGEALVATFTLTQPASVFRGIVAAVHATPGYGLPSERAAFSTFTHRIGEANKFPSATIIFGYGAWADVGDASVRASEVDAGCWALGTAGEGPLPAGTYRGVAIGAADGGARFGYVLGLPPGVALDVRAVPAQRISEAELVCARKVHVVAGPAMADALDDCRASLVAEREAYYTIWANWKHDERHRLSWLAPDGTPVPGKCECTFHKTGAGPAGTWTLDAPEYVAARGGPVFDMDIIGAFADV